MSYTKSDTAYGDTLTHHKKQNRPSSVTSSICPNPRSSIDNDWYLMPGNFERVSNITCSLIYWLGFVFKC